MTLTGRYAHHLRVPWTARMSEWRDATHVQVNSPSMTLIPPTVVHTIRAVGAGPHTLIDVFAPPREDFRPDLSAFRGSSRRRNPGPELPRNGRAGEFTALQDPTGTCTLWFCVSDPGPGPSRWAQVVLGPQFDGSAWP